MPTPVPPADWHAQTYGAYARSSNEAFENAICVYNLLHSLNWSLSAICGLYGNVEAESGYNPWRWEGDYVPTSYGSRSHGYGFCQFTPASKYIDDSAAQANTGYGPNYSDQQGNIFDGDSQLRFIDVYADYIPTYDYPLSYADYKVNNNGPEYSARAWVKNYERPGDQSEEALAYRASIARHWYDILIEYDPSTPIPPEPGPIPPKDRTGSYNKKFKIMFYLKPWYKRL